MLLIAFRSATFKNPFPLCKEVKEEKHNVDETYKSSPLHVEIFTPSSIND